MAGKRTGVWELIKGVKMKIRVRDIEELWKDRFAALVAGRGGLDRIVEF